MKAVIVCGSKIENYERVKTYLSKEDFYIFCDCGLKHERFLGYKANLIVGDFDSYANPERNTETIVLPTEKDDTDSAYAVKEAVKRGYKEILIIGGIGERLDHSLVNFYILLDLYNKGILAKIIDDYSEISVIGSGKKGEISDDYSFFSLIAMAGAASGVTITNAKFLLDNGTIKPEYQYATSNEVIKGGQAEVTVKTGVLGLIKIF